MKKHGFKTLQGKLIILLLFPVIIVVFSGGIVSFLYTRNVMLNQWNESAILKLQRAAHALEMKISKPIDMVNLFYKTNPVGDIPGSQKKLIQYLAGMDGVVKVGFTYSRSTKGHMEMGSGSSMRFHRSMLLDITEPQYNADAGQETVKMVLTLLNSSNQTVGNIEIIMDFRYLLKDISNLGWWQSDRACIISNSGRFIVHANSSMKGRKILGDTGDPFELAVLKELTNKPFGTVKSKGHPPKTISGFYKLDNAPWAITLFAEGDKILAPITRYRNAFAIGSLGLLIIILFLIRFHVGKIVTKITLLSENAKKVAKGEYGDPISRNSEDEIGQLVSNYNLMVKGLVERDYIRDTFGRYIDPDFAKFLLEHPDAGELGGKRQEVAIMMSDIRGFTALSETLSPEVIIKILNQYFSHMITIIQKYNGIIVDFLGDAILVFFEPFSNSIDDTIYHCICCASDMQNQMKDFNTEMNNQNLPELAMGIGINSGQVIIGNIGSDARKKYGIVGSAVNITSRIQSKAEGNEVILSQTAFDHVKNKIRIAKSFKADLKGVDSPMDLHVIKNH
ncbi:MAG: adenylate/guanylate cyclase domain-containing protein [Desulfobacula sp.]|nr:adenylate/guanylate cyclase domain-containing protein [Desulfobacula sp.]